MYIWFIKKYFYRSHERKIIIALFELWIQFKFTFTLIQKWITS